MPRENRWLWFALAASLLIASPAFADPDDWGHHAIWEKLTDSTYIEFTDVPLRDGIDFLKDFHSLPIDIDEKALKAAGFDHVRSAFTVKVENKPLHVGLRLFLHEHDLSFMIKNGKLTVTTLKAAAEWQKRNFANRK